MFNCGLGTSLSSITDFMDPALIEVLRNSEIKTFELNVQMFFHDYDGEIIKSFKAMLAETGKRVISFHIPFAGRDDLWLAILLSADGSENAHHKRFKLIVGKAVFISERSYARQYRRAAPSPRF